MNNPAKFLGCLLCAIGIGGSAGAVTLTYDVTGSANVTGFLTIDLDQIVPGTNQPYQNALVIDALDLTVYGTRHLEDGTIFSTVNGSGDTTVDDSGPVPVIVSGSGFLSTTAVQDIALILGGDGDADLQVSDVNIGFVTEPVRFTARLADVPLPAGGLLLAGGIGALGLVRRGRTLSRA